MILLRWYLVDLERGEGAMKRRDFIQGVGGMAAASPFRPFAAAAQQPEAGYPSRPITLIVPYAAGGGGNDVMARGVAIPMSKTLGQPIVIENHGGAGGSDRKSTRLNSSHTVISYAVFCLKKKKKKNYTHTFKKKKKKKKKHKKKKKTK